MLAHNLRVLARKRLREQAAREARQKKTRRAQKASPRRKSPEAAHLETNRETNRPGDHPFRPTRTRAAVKSPSRVPKSERK